jgi:hypothetical protein
MNDEDFPEYDFQVNLTIEDIYLLHHSVKETIKYWPGSPSRPADEQEHLWYLRDSLYRMILEHQFQK